MKVMRIKLSQYGFSLTEVMVAVAIVGILAGIVVPQYQKYQRKSMQNEAKLLLSGLYTSERVFISNWGFGATNFHQLGFSPKGGLNYNTGWDNAPATTDITTSRPARYNGPIVSGSANIDHRNTKKCCTHGSCSMPTTSLTLPTNNHVTNTDFKNVEFVIGAAGDLHGGNEDHWTIDHRKQLINTQSGL